MQTKFRDRKILEHISADFEKTTKDIMVRLKQEMRSDIILERLVSGPKVLERSDTRQRRRPEDVTKEIIIDPLLKFLGYSRISRSSGSENSGDAQEVDYILEVENDRILVEAEPINKQLFNQKKQGVEQLKDYLEKKSFRSDLGIASNGFEWVLVKYDTKSYTYKQIEHVNLRSLFSISSGQALLVSANDELQRLYFSFAADHILSVSEEYTRELEEAKKNITKRFYEDYIRYVFGYDKRSKGQVRCLLNSLEIAGEAKEPDRRLFVITLMSRLLFIKFLEDKRLVKSGLLRSLLAHHQNSQIPATFYKTYLQPLFYEVLNTPLNSRRSNILAIRQFDNIPYLNGGLFREVVSNERQFDVHDDIIAAIIDVLEAYAFTLEDNPNALNPDILGLVFEKTINYLTGEGTDKRKDLGAYYTPDDVTTYISTGIIQKRILNIVKEYLKSIKWKKSDIDQYITIDDFLDNLPSNPKTIKAIYEKLRGLTVLDPACGSGHFLTSVMKELYRIYRKVATGLNVQTSSYDIKKEIITSNLFGVDIESSAVEIARLRLWLSLIEDLDVRSSSSATKIEALPNIEYNIFEGNGLLGFTAPLTVEQMAIMNDTVTTSQIFSEVDELKKSFRSITDPRKVYELKKAIDERICSYNNALNKKLAAYLASENMGNFSAEQLSTMKPFHWRLHFSDVFIRNAGFDIVIGNPPYVETNKVLMQYPIMLFDTLQCGNIYAHFVENSLKLLKENGRLGMIMPISAFCTQRMADLIQLIERNCDQVWLSHYGWRPSKLFEGVNRALSIMLAEKQSGKEINCKFYTTTYMKWYTQPIDERPLLFKTIKYHRLKRKYERFIIPKIGSDLEESMLEKVYGVSEKRLGNFFSNDETRHVLYFRTTGGLYWKIITDFQPKFFKGEIQTESSRESHLYFRSEDHKLLALAVYNSNFFWWFYTINSNARDLNPFDLRSVPIDLDDISSDIKIELKKLVRTLMKDLDKNAQYAERSHKKAAPVKYQKISPRLSKGLIDEIDRLLA